MLSQNSDFFVEEGYTLSALNKSIFKSLGVSYDDLLILEWVGNQSSTVRLTLAHIFCTVNSQ